MEGGAVILKMMKSQKIEDKLQYRKKLLNTIIYNKRKIHPHQNEQTIPIEVDAQEELEVKNEETVEKGFNSCPDTKQTTNGRARRNVNIAGFLTTSKRIAQNTGAFIVTGWAYKRPMFYEKDKADKRVDGNNHENEGTKEETKKE